MKKQLLTLGLLIAGTAAFSQCTFSTSDVDAYIVKDDPNATWGGMPDTTDNMPVVGLNDPYDATLAFKLPSSAQELDPNQPNVPLNSLEIISIAGLPPGMTFVSVTSTTDNIFCGGQGSQATNCKWAGGAYGCVRIMGTATALGTYPLDITLEGQTSFGGGQGQLPGYKLVVTPVGIDVVGGNAFNVRQNVPNPFSQNTKIRFTVAQASNAKFYVMNLLGEVVYNQDVVASEGDNTINFNASNLNEGIYMYTLQIGETKVTKRMVVNK